MRLAVISPEALEPREPAVLARLFAAGLECYHIRKPAVPAAALENWLQALPVAWRPHFVLHTHHELVARLNLGGRHYREVDAARLPRPSGFASRACHDLVTLRSAVGHYDSVLLSPVFPSVSKPGHLPDARLAHTEIVATLAARTPHERRTAVLALGGITRETAPLARDLGFDGVAVLGAIWRAPDPERAFGDLQHALFAHAA